MAVKKRNRNAKVTELKLDTRSETLEETLVLDFHLGESKKSLKKGNASYIIDDALIPGPKSNDITDFYEAGLDVKFLRPQLNPEALIKLANSVAMLRACIDSMKVNIEGHGYSFEFVGAEGNQGKAKAVKELKTAKAILKTVNTEIGYIELRKRIRADLETLGYAFAEITRDALGQVREIHHVDSHTITLSTKHPEPQKILCKYTVDGDNITHVSERTFRIFRQKVGSQRLYFKEFGDPRTIDAATGKFVEETDNEGGELVYFCLYSTGYSYGMPRWVGAMASALGSREAELTNLEFFKRNGIPAMVVLVSGGTLLEDSYEMLQNIFRPGRSREQMHTVAVIEGVGDEEAATATNTIPPPKIEIKSLHDERQTDAMFLEYLNQCNKNIRRSFRIGSLLLGDTEDTTYATAEATTIVSESQVFGPERHLLDSFFNDHVLIYKGFPLENWRLKSNPARLVNPDSLSKALKAFNQVGSLTPNATIDIFNRLLDMSIEKVDADWGDYPFDISKILAALGRLKGIEEIEKSPEEIAAMFGASSGNSGGSDASLGTTNNLGSSNPTNEARDQSNNKSLQKEILATLLNNDETF